MDPFDALAKRIGELRRVPIRIWLEKSYEESLPDGPEYRGAALMRLGEQEVKALADEGPLYVVHQVGKIQGLPAQLFTGGSAHKSLTAAYADLRHTFEVTAGLQ